jgi:hypothetical protein
MNILSHPVQVVMITMEQQALLNEPFNHSAVNKKTFDKAIITEEQKESIPDVIDGLILTAKDKKDLLFDAFIPKDSNIYYFVDENKDLKLAFEAKQENKVYNQESKSRGR